MMIYDESRITKLALTAAELPDLGAECEEISEGEELTSKDKLTKKCVAMETLVAADLVVHFKKRHEARYGKAMILCMRGASAWIPTTR